PEWHRFEFVTERALRGRPGDRFAVLEPAGACCGRSLFALQTGDRCLLFLRRTGALLHPLGGARGVLPADAAVVAHTEALLAAADDRQRTALLAAALGSDAARV